MNGAVLTDMSVNLPEVVAEVIAVFDCYETALIANDVAVLDELFWDSAYTVRYGIAEILYGAAAIRAWRQAFVPSGSMARCLRHRVVTTFGQQFATVDVEFLRDGQPVGRQSQTWVRFGVGWRVTSAHVSMLQVESQ